MTVTEDDILTPPSADLFRKLREHCPKLRYIRRAAPDGFARGELTEDDHLNLLRSTSHLAYYNLTMLVHAPFL